MPVFANNGSLVIMAVTKAVIAVIMVGSAAYCLIMQIPIPDAVVNIILLILGGYFGYSAKVYNESQQNQRRMVGQMFDAIMEGSDNARE